MSAQRVDVLAVLNAVVDRLSDAEAGPVAEAIDAVRELVRSIEFIAYKLEHIPRIDENARRFVAEDLRAALARFGGTP